MRLHLKVKDVVLHLLLPTLLRSPFLPQDATHSVVGLEFDFQYVAGYGPAGAPGGSNFTLAAYSTTLCTKTMISSLWESPVLANYSYDQCNTC